MFSNITLTLVGTPRCCTNFEFCLGGRGRKWVFHFHLNIPSASCFTRSILKSWSCWHDCLLLCFLLLVYENTMGVVTSIILLSSSTSWCLWIFCVFSFFLLSLQKGTILGCNLETKDNLQVLELPCSKSIRTKHAYFAQNPHPSREERRNQLQCRQAIPYGYTSSRFTHNNCEDK